jgi:hypothetical protein
MKINKSCIVLMLISIIGFSGMQAQASLKKLGVIKIESRGWREQQPFTQLVRIEMDKLIIYEVLNRYDVEDVMRKNKVDMEACLNKDCILEAGRLLKADYMLSGTIEKINNKVLIMFRELEVSTGNTTKTVTKEFPDDDKRAEDIIEVSLKEMYGVKMADDNKQSMSDKNAIANGVNNANQSTVSIGGARFGVAFLTGAAAEFVKRSKDDGGYGGYPAFFQFGYQFEKMYLNEGNLQAIFEFIPTISGVDQAHFIPSFTFMNGFRSAKNGWEFAFGPTITWTKAIDSYQDSSSQWHFAKDYNPYHYDPATEQTSYVPLPFPVVQRNHTKGDLIAKPGLIIAAGKTFKSGRLNMPLNVYVIPRKGAVQFGISYGFNAMKKKTPKS